MRKITSLVAALLLSVATFAQAPQGFSYQAVVRDAQNAIVSNQTVDVTLTITAEIDGEAVQTYTEKHSVTTNANGLFTLVVGQGESKQKLSDIKWNMPNAIYNMRTETAYGTATTQLLSVPFALYAEQAGELDYQKLAKTLTSDEVQALLGYVKANDLADYAKKSDIPVGANLDNYVLNDSLVLLIANVEATYAKKSDIPAATDLSDYAKTADVEAVYAKKSDIQAAADMSGYVKADTLSQYALNSSLTSYISKETFADYILSGGKIESVDLTVYAKTADVDATYAKKSDIPAATDLSGYAKTADVASAYVTKETFDAYVLSGGQADSVDLTVFAKTADVEATYAKKSDIPAPTDLSGYAKTDTLSQYALNTSLTKYVTKEAFDAYVLSGGQADSVDLTAFAKTADVEATYARKSDIPATADLSGYAKAADVVSKETFANYILGAGNPDAVDLNVYAKTADVEATYAKKSDIPAAADLSGYAKTDTLSQYALNTSLTKYVTKETFDAYVLSGGQADSVDLTVFAKTADVEATYAKKSDIPAAADMSAYAKTADVAAGYVTKETFDNYVLSGGQADSVDLTVYAKTADVNAALSLSNHYNDSVFARKSDIPATPDLSGFVKSDTLSIYALKSSLNNYATLRFVDDTLNYFRSAYALKSEIPTIPTVPTKVSDLENDANYLTEHQDISGKQDVIDDIETIRIGATLGATALQSHQSLAAYTTTAKLNDTLAAYATTAKLNDTLAVYTKAADVEAAYATKTEVAGIQNAISDLETIRIGAALGATALQEHQSLADYVTTAKLNDTLAEYVTTAKLNDTLAVYTKAADVEAAYATKTEVAGKQDVIDDIETIRIGANLGATALQEHQSLADYATTAKLNDTLAEYATTAKLNDTLAAYATTAKLNDTLNAYTKTADLAPVAITGSYNDLTDKPTILDDVPTKLSDLTADKIGDMPMATVNVTVTTEDDVVATVSFLGRELTSGTTGFRIPAYSPVFLSVSLSKYSDGNRKYSYTVKINGKPFDPVTGYYYAIYPSNPQNLKIVGVMGTPTPEEILSGDYYGTFSGSNLRVVKTPIYKTGSGKSLDIPAHWFENDFSAGHAPVVTDAERNMVNQVVGPFPNAVNTIEITVGHIDIYN